MLKIVLAKNFLLITLSKRLDCFITMAFTNAEERLYMVAAPCRGEFQGRIETKQGEGF